MQREEDYTLAKLILPEEILEFFKIKNIVSIGESYHIHLEEKNIPLEEYSHHKLTSKGFYEEATIQDFPIRGKAVFLHVKRRRWLNETTGDMVCRTWELVAKGTRMTKEFAAFLKAISR